MVTAHAQKRTSHSLPAPAIISSSIKQLPTSPSLLGLPHELRLQIYGYLTHMPDLLRPGWRYSPSLIYVCRQIYHETIILLYQNTKFSFSNPEQCLAFLAPIGYNLKYIRCLDVGYNEKQLSRLQDLLKQLGSGSHLHTLELFQVQLGGRAHTIRKYVRFTTFHRNPDETDHPLGVLKRIRPLKVDTFAAHDFGQIIQNLIDILPRIEQTSCLQAVLSPWFDENPRYMVGESGWIRNGDEFGGHCFLVHDSVPSSK
ncbi:hypothetical protein PVAG01_06460 [Phlyctema vagabunda]|uniref:DUF7730 domain-containing protein n=1 Tax=Phlyctema vagabunda TaxID=108571 RepID=A0ABR4PG74_9HELO